MRCSLSKSASRIWRRSVTAAAKTNDVSATHALNSWITTIRSTRSMPANRPWFPAAAVMTTTEANSPAGAAPSCWKRHAIQARNGRIRNNRPSGDRAPTTDAAASPEKTTTTSPIRGQLGGPNRTRATVHSTGATISTPIASPVHQTDQVRATPAVSPLATARVNVPRDALIVMAASATRTTPTASRRRSSFSSIAKRRRSHAAARGARVLPTAMAAATPAGSVRATLTAKAAMAMAGQTR